VDKWCAGAGAQKRQYLWNA